MKQIKAIEQKVINTNKRNKMKTFSPCLIEDYAQTKGDEVNNLEKLCSGLLSGSKMVVTKTDLCFKC